jgi:hypothetical protein
MMANSVLVPGLADMMTMPAAGKFHVNVCAQVTVTCSDMVNVNGFSVMNLAFYVDNSRTLGGFPGNQGGAGPVGALNNFGVAGQEVMWSQCYTFPSGTWANGSTHTFQLGVNGTSIGGSPAIIGGPAGSAEQGDLWVEIIMQ